jgi:hypothetical protein
MSELGLAGEIFAVAVIIGLPLASFVIIMKQRKQQAELEKSK